MAYRFKIGDVTIECDTSVEAIKFYNSLNLPVLPFPIATSHDEERTAIQTHPMSSKRDPRVSNSVKQFLSALKDAYPSPITSEDLAEKLGKNPKGLPAIVLGVRVLFRRWAVPFEEMIEWTKRVQDDAIVRQYKLTTFGLKTLKEHWQEDDTETMFKGQNDVANSF